MARILVAVQPSAYDQLHSLLADQFEIDHARNIDEALELSRQNAPDIILCDMHFDDSRMLQFCTEAKEDTSLKHIPFVCIQLFDSRLPPSIINTLDRTSKTLGASAFLNLSKLLENADATQMQLLLGELNLASPENGERLV